MNNKSVSQVVISTFILGSWVYFTFSIQFVAVRIVKILDLCEYEQKNADEGLQKGIFECLWLQEGLKIWEWGLEYTK